MTTHKPIPAFCEKVGQIVASFLHIDSPIRRSIYTSMSFCLFFYGLVLLFYDFLAYVDYSSLIGLTYFRRVQQQIGVRQAHWLLRAVAVILVLVGIHGLT